MKVGEGVAFPAQTIKSPSIKEKKLCESKIFTQL
jgi:hypothetical protein